MQSSRFFSLFHSKPCSHREWLTSLRRFLAVLLACLMMTLSVPPAMAGQLARDVIFESGNSANHAWLMLSSFMTRWTRGAKPPGQQGVRPRPPESKADREARVASLELNPGSEVTLQSRQPIIFTAIPLDRDGNAIHGLHAEWESTDRQVIFIKKNGQAMAGKPGYATLTATAGQKRGTVRVTVIEGGKEPFGPPKATTTRSRPRAANEPKTPNGDLVTGRRAEGRAHHAKKSVERLYSSAPTLTPQRQPNDDPLPDNETASLYQAGNTIGSPPGKKKGGALTPAVATMGTENGNQNFSFALPITDLPGRGLDASLALAFNSQVWNKSTDPSDNSTWMSYDVDSGWPAQGFRISFGQIDNQGSYGFTLTDPDGTRHALTYTSANNYETTDGTFIHYYGGSTWGTLFYPDGTIAYYGAGGNGYRLYPTEIKDRNGNYILINYVNNVGPKISSIEDTLQRYIHFYYASNGDLVTITAPGLTGNSDRQVMRFYYQDFTLSTSIFASGINVSTDHPNTIHTLQYVYLPASSDGNGSTYMGYKFDFRSYGAMYQITQFRGMSVSSLSTSDAGSVSSEGTMAAQTTYNYSASPSGLTDGPKYDTRTDEWRGRTTGGSAPSYQFSTTDGNGEKISTVTAPDGTVSETHAKINAGQWDDGLVTDTYTKDGTNTLARTHLEWQRDSNNLNPRVYQAVTTDVSAGLSKATVLSYTSYNNVSVVSERDFGGDQTTPSTTELRRTETAYVTSSSYINRHLLHLPSSVKVYPSGSNTPASRVDYAYDNYGTGHANLTARDDTIMHDVAFDPFQQTQENCYWECTDWEWNPYTDSEYCADWEYICDTYNPYDPNTDYRGNVTSVTTYADAPNALQAITHSTTYDIAGNVITAQVDCCQQKSFTYSGAGSGQLHDYAYPISVTSGNPSGTYTTTQAQFDMNTGLVSWTKDENVQQTSNSFNTNSLRLSQIDYPDSGQTKYFYSDALDSSYHFNVETQVKLDSTRIIDSYRFFDGRGAVTRSQSNQTSANGYMTQDVEYDAMGRAYRAGNPYYAGLASSSINPDGYWTTSTFDHLGRVTQVQMPQGVDDSNHTLLTSVTSEYSGVFTTVTDQAGKVRRQKVDALGRVIRLDEPTSSGLGSTSSPNQATSYDYDALDNLVHINQGAQHRYFKFDSLSRLIRERQVEQNTNSNYDLSDSLTGNSSWSRRIDYNSSGLVTDAYDARGVHTQFSYDDLNRVTTITYSDSTPAAHYYYDNQTLPSGAPSYTHTNTTGRLLAMTYGSSSSTAGDYFAYDSMGRVTTQKEVTGSTTYSLSYGYNYAGLLTSETYPSNRALSYAYDEGGRLSQLSDGTNTFAGSFTYAPHGGLTSETFGNNMVHKLEYNRRLQASTLKLLQNSSATTPLQQYDYGYGQFNTSDGSIDTSKNNGQIGKITGTISGTSQWNQGFSYDELGRLSNVTEHAGSGMTTQTLSQSYTFDRYGNRFQSANSTLGLIGVSSSEIDASTNRFINSGSTPTTYDFAGNIIQDTKFRGMNYSYDANGRMTYSYRTDYTDAESSSYDCAGQRVQTSANSVTRTMVYDVFGQLVADYLGSSGSTLERENIYRGGQLLAVYETGASCYKSIAQFVSDFYQDALGRAYNSSSDPDWVTTLTQAQGQGELIVAAQNLGNSVFTSTEFNNHLPDTPANRGAFVTALYASYLGRSPDPGGYNAWLDALNNGSSRDSVRNGFAYSAEFQNDMGQLCVTTASSGIKYVLSDVQGTARAVMDNNGSSSAVIARHDFLPFGEEIWTGRSSSNAYFKTDSNRQKYGLTERDDATGLDHTWWRKLESFSGRWSTPDPLNGTNSDPQSFNHYSYVLNDPVNLIDPMGLDCWATYLVTRADGKIIAEKLIGVWCDPKITTLPQPIPFINTELRGLGTRSDFVSRKPTTQQLMDKGKEWDRWQKWVDCNTPIMAKYNQQLHDYHKIGGEAFWLDVGTGIAAGVNFAGGVPGAIRGGFLVLGVIYKHRDKINGIISDYQAEVDKTCGPKPPHP